jgi:hypothetical protein
LKHSFTLHLQPSPSDPADNGSLVQQRCPYVFSSTE